MNDIDLYDNNDETVIENIKTIVDAKIFKSPLIFLDDVFIIVVNDNILIDPIKPNGGKQYDANIIMQTTKNASIAFLIDEVDRNILM